MQAVVAITSAIVTAVNIKVWRRIFTPRIPVTRIAQGNSVSRQQFRSHIDRVLAPT